jgi:hypothetical protein
MALQKFLKNSKQSEKKKESIKTTPGIIVTSILKEDSNSKKPIQNQMTMKSNYFIFIIMNCPYYQLQNLGLCTYTNTLYIWFYFYLNVIFLTLCNFRSK